MSRSIHTRVRQLESRRPAGLHPLTDAELEARIADLAATLLSEYGSVEAVVASYTADGNEPAARLMADYFAVSST